MVCYLLDYNVNIDVFIEIIFDSVLMWVCIFGNEVIVELLLERILDVEYRIKDGCIVFMFAVLVGYVKVVVMLFDYGVEINVESDSNKDSFFIFVCWKGYCDVVELFLERKVNIEYRTKEGFILFMFVVFGGYIDVVRKLFERKVKVNVFSGSNNDILLISVCWKGYYDVVKFLFEFKFNIEYRIKDGCILFMLVVWYVDVNFV